MTSINRTTPSPLLAQKSLATTQNSAKLLVESGEIFPEMLTLIQGAQKLIQMDIFLLGGQPGNQIADALIQKIKDGNVSVRVMYDPGVGYLGEAKRSMKDVLARLKAAGAEVQPYPMDKLPKNKLPGQNSGQIDHNKVLVVDGKCMMLGGMNWNTAGQSNRDLMVRIDGPAAAAMGQALNDEWMLAGKAGYAGELPEPSASGDADVELTMTAPSTQNTEQRLIELYSQAQESIYVGMYQFDDDEVAEALIAAYKRGVDVRVMLSRNDRYGKYAPVVGNLMNGMPNRAIANQLQAAGVPVRWYDPTKPDEEMHGKYTIVDHQVLGLGSTNFTEKAFSIIRESEAFIHSPNLAQDAEKRMFLRDWENHSTPVPKPNLWQRLLGKIVEFLRDTKLAWW